MKYIAIFPLIVLISSVSTVSAKETKNNDCERAVAKTAIATVGMTRCAAGPIPCVIAVVTKAVTLHEVSEKCRPKPTPEPSESGKK